MLAAATPITSAQSSAKVTTGLYVTFVLETASLTKAENAALGLQSDLIVDGGGHYKPNWQRFDSRERRV